MNFDSYKIFAFCFSFAACLSLAACKNDIKEVKALFVEKNADVEVGKGISLVYSDSGTVVLTLKAPTMLKYLDKHREKLEFPDGVTVDFYDKHGKLNSHLIADYAIRIKGEEKIIAQDNVVLYNFQGDTLRTDKLIWSEEKEKIYSDQFVKISTPREVLYGFGFETDPGFQNFKLREISGRMEVDKLP